MKKQELLDLETTEPRIWGLQQLVRECSKTELEAMGRVFRKLDKTLYKSSTQSLPLLQLKHIVDQASEMIRNGEIED